MLTKGLDQETEQLLADILQRENITTDELIKTLIRDRWLTLKKTDERTATTQTTESDIPELPQTSESEAVHAAKQKSNKQAIAEFIRKKRFY